MKIYWIRIAAYDSANLRSTIAHALMWNVFLEYKFVLSEEDGLKLNGTHQLLAYADDVNILGGSVHTVKENAEALVAAIKEIGLEVNAHKTKYMTVSRDQNAGRIHSMKKDNSSIEKSGRVQIFGRNFNKSKFY